MNNPSTRSHGVADVVRHSRRSFLGLGAMAVLAGCASGPARKTAPPNARVGRHASPNPGSVNTMWLFAPKGLIVIDSGRNATGGDRRCRRGTRSRPRPAPDPSNGRDRAVGAGADRVRRLRRPHAPVDRDQLAWCLGRSCRPLAGACDRGRGCPHRGRLVGGVSPARAIRRPA